MNLFEVEVTSAAILALIENYCREAGVRNLQKQIEKIYRKIALQLVRQGAISESAVAEEVAEPEEAKAEGVDKSSQNTVGSDTVVETATVETISQMSKLMKPLFMLLQSFQMTKCRILVIKLLI